MVLMTQLEDGGIEAVNMLTPTKNINCVMEFTLEVDGIL